jgi:hypothetical protein
MLEQLSGCGKPDPGDIWRRSRVSVDHPGGRGLSPRWAGVPPGGSSGDQVGGGPGALSVGWGSARWPSPGASPGVGRRRKGTAALVSFDDEQLPGCLQPEHHRRSLTCDGRRALGFGRGDGPSGQGCLVDARPEGGHDRRPIRRPGVYSACASNIFSITSIDGNSSAVSRRPVLPAPR